jgi:SAM-dependent methyltransferase
MVTIDSPSTELAARSRAPGASSAAPDRAAQRRAWEKVADSVADFSQATSTQYYRACEIALIERAAAPLAGKRVLKLDLWNEAFNTRILHWIEEQGAAAVGIDHSIAISRRARRNGRAEGASPALYRADIRELPFAEGSFDFVYTMGTIEHIDEEVRRVLRPGGRAIIGVPDRWNIFLRPLMVEILTRMGAYLYAPEKSFSERELRGVVEDAGFRVLGRSGCLVLPGLLRMADLFLYTRRIPLGALQRAMIAPFRFAELRWPALGRFGYLMALTVERPA